MTASGFTPKRHYDLAGVATYWSARMYKDLRIALAG